MILWTILLSSFLAAHVSAECNNCQKGYGDLDQMYGYVKSSFYWFFYSTAASESNKADRPLLVVVGCPGQSAAGYHNFMASGPIDIDNQPRIGALTEHYNVLYVDPSQVGFAKCRSNKNPYNGTDMADELKETVLQFLDDNTEFRKSPMYVLGDGICAKAAVRLVKMLYEVKDQNCCKCKLKGLFLAAPWISPITQIESWSEYLFDFGHVDFGKKSLYDTKAKEIDDAYKNHTLRNSLLLFQNYEQEIVESTSGITMCNVFPEFNVDHDQSYQPKRPRQFVSSVIRCHDHNKLKNFMNSKVKPALTDISRKQNFNQYELDAIKDIENDFFEAAISEMSFIMTKEISVNIITGQMDVISNNRGAENWIQDVVRSGNPLWTKADYKPFEYKTSCHLPPTPPPEPSPVPTSITEQTTVPYEYESTDEVDTTVPYELESTDGVDFLQSFSGANSLAKGYRRKYGITSYFLLNKIGHNIYQENPCAMKTIIDKIISEEYN